MKRMHIDQETHIERVLQLIGRFWI